MFGKKRTMVIVLLILAAGTALAALATTIGVMITARVIQGAGGAVFPLSFSIIRDEFPRQRVPHGIALISAIMGIGGGLGIVLAGPIVQHLSYHWLFWLPLVAVLIATAGIVAYVPESPIRTPGRVDSLGAVLLAGWLVAFLVPISQGPTWGWLSARTLGLFAIAAVVFPVWIWVESRSEAPLVDMRMMRLRPVWTTNLAALVIGFGMFASFILVPQFVELPTSTGFGFGASVTEAGLYMVPATLGMLLVGPVSGRLSATVGSKVPLVLGALTSCVAFVMLAVAHSSSWEIYVAMLVMGVGIGFAFGSMANLIIESVPARADRGGDRHEHDRAEHRRSDREPGLGRDRDRDACVLGTAHRARVHDRVPRCRRGAGRRRLRRAAGSGAGARGRGRGDRRARHERRGGTGRAAPGRPRPCSVSASG